MSAPGQRWSKAWAETIAQKMLIRADWVNQAECVSSDPDLFFPIRGENATTAKEICATCPVWLDCLEHAVKGHERHGVWGGLTERERRRIPKNKKLSEVAKLCKSCGVIRLFKDQKCEKCGLTLPKKRGLFSVPMS